MTLFDYISGATEFNFYVKEINDVENAISALRHYSILSTELAGDRRGQRCATFIGKNEARRQNYLLFKMDAKDEISAQKVIEFFTQYKHILIAENNDITKLRGIVFTDIFAFQVRDAYKTIWEALSQYGLVDVDIARNYGYLKPLSGKVVSKNASGDLYPYKYKKPDLPVFEIEAKDFDEACSEYFAKWGFIKDFNTGNYWKDNIEYQRAEKWPFIMKCVSNHLLDINIKTAIAPLFDQSAPLSGTHVFSQALQETDYKAQIDNLLERMTKLENEIVAIKSYMGSGKSNAIEYAIKEAHKLKKKCWSLPQDNPLQETSKIDSGFRIIKKERLTAKNR